MTKAVLKALRVINEETILISWCHPHPCQGDVVKAAAEWLEAQES